MDIGSKFRNDVKCGWNFGDQISMKASSVETTCGPSGLKIHGRTPFLSWFQGPQRTATQGMLSKTQCCCLTHTQDFLAELSKWTVLGARYGCKKKLAHSQSSVGTATSEKWTASSAAWQKVNWRLSWQRSYQFLFAVRSTIVIYYLDQVEFTADSTSKENSGLAAYHVIARLWAERSRSPRRLGFLEWCSTTWEIAFIFNMLQSLVKKKHPEISNQ